MCLMCDGYTDSQITAMLNADIETHGWTVQYVEDPIPARRFGYTIGLTLKGEAEFLVRGMDLQDTCTMLNGLATSVIKKHEHFAKGHTSSWIDGRKMYFSQMHGASKFALGAYARYGWDTKVLEVHFLDRDVPEETPAMIYKNLALPITRSTR